MVYQKKRIRLDIPMRIATKFILSFLVIIIFISAVFMAVGVQIIGNRIISEAQEKVAHDLNAAREIYLSNLTRINYVVRLTADRFLIKEALLTGDVQRAASDMVKVAEREKLDVLTLTDESGYVIFRASNPKLKNDNQSHDELVSAVMQRKEPLAATSIIPVEDLLKESSLLADKAYFQFIETPRARAREEKEETDGMMLIAAAPIFDEQNQLIGIIYGGVLLNRNYEIVDKIKQTVFEDIQYRGKDIGTATIFQDDVRISTNVRIQDGSRAIGTRAAEDVYSQVVNEGKPWIGRAYVVNNWYITAYEPIRNIDQEIIGILYVGLLEEKYLDVKRNTIQIFLAITFMGALISVAFSYIISRRISGSINKLASASKELAQGNLNTKVEITSNDELQDLANNFNLMALKLKERDEKLKEFTRTKIMESEKLALVGQLSANVAHELNNPLQGIIAYSHLLLEKMQCENAGKESVQKIVIQANRCRDIIRGLLDFSRQRKPQKTLCDINSVLQECISLLENQALFHNIKIIKDFDIDRPMVIIDPSQIERVFMNLIINASEAMDGNGQLTLVTRFDSATNFLEVEFTDTGHGIADENMMKIFDPFFTTKETGHGVGLGLAISYGIVKEHRGTISVESELGKGTTFVVSLPLRAIEEDKN